MKKRGLLAVLLIAVMTLLCGCGGMSAEDAQSYAKSIMDASYKGEFDKYIEWTKSSEEEAKELYEGNIDATMQEAGFAGLGLSDELTESYRELFLNMIKQAKYEVGEAKDAVYRFRRTSGRGAGSSHSRDDKHDGSSGSECDQ